jgi:hypothetical protein
MQLEFVVLHFIIIASDFELTQEIHDSPHDTLSEPLCNLKSEHSKLGHEEKADR